MEVDNYHSESEGDSAFGMQQKMDAMECDGSCSQTNDVTPCDATYSQTHSYRTRQAYTLAFKLSVVEAYRNNGECKGNQRATARKFHIHRRQVQRWIRDERALVQKFRLRVAAAEIARGSVKEDATLQPLGNDAYQHHTSCDNTTSCHIVHNTGDFPRDLAANASTAVGGAQKEDAVIDLSVTRRRDALEPTTGNLGNEDLQQSVKQTALAAFHSANKWHGIAAGVAQKFGIMVCDLIRWLKEEYEWSMFPAAVVPNEPARLSNDTYLPANANLTGSDMYLAVLRHQAGIIAAQYYSQQAQSFDLTAAISAGFCRWPYIHVDAIVAGEALKCLYRQISQHPFAFYNVMSGPSYQCPIAPHFPLTQDSLSHAAFCNAELPVVRPILPPSEDQDGRIKCSQDFQEDLVEKL